MGRDRDSSQPAPHCDQSLAGTGYSVVEGLRSCLITENTADESHTNGGSILYRLSNANFPVLPMHFRKMHRQAISRLVRAIGSFRLPLTSPTVKGRQIDTENFCCVFEPRGVGQHPADVLIRQFRQRHRRANLKGAL